MLGPDDEELAELDEDMVSPLFGPLPVTFPPSTPSAGGAKGLEGCLGMEVGMLLMLAPIFLGLAE